MLYFVMLAVVLWLFRVDRMEKKRKHDLRKGIPEKQKPASSEDKKNKFESGGSLHHVLTQNPDKEKK
ncbi:MAG: hypothetical protein ABIQ40_13840 [Bacteroidia bacterium]